MNDDTKGATVMSIRRRGPKPADKKEKQKSEFEKTPLMSYLAAEAQDRGESPAELAKNLGIGYVYLTQLLRGKKDTAKLGREILVAAAKYLRVPVIQAYLWAGALKPSDFIYERDEAIFSGTPYEVMARHQNWGGFMPSKKDWEKTPNDAKQVMIRMFEELTGQTIIDKNRMGKIPPGSLD
jgi:transcriptional regulator with XRE-family HTH domain